MLKGKCGFLSIKAHALCTYFCNKNYVLCIMQLKYCAKYIAFCVRKLINIVFDFSPPEWDPTRPKVYLLLYASKEVHKLCIMHNALYIVHYATHFLKYVQINSSILLVDFFHWKLHPQCILYNCFILHALCIM